MNLGIFLPNWIGDVVMATPALRALRTRFPEARITGVLKPYLAEVLEGTRWIDDLLFHKPGLRDNKLGEWPLIKELRKRKLDAVVLFTNSVRTGFLAWASGARERIGYMRALRGAFLTTKLFHPLKD